ncbi:MAG: hypothetical protein NTU79_23825 [Planctomycetota bacterium]|nr:hypothetical protein [Planctomycetota bacterium]
MANWYEKQLRMCLAAQGGRLICAGAEGCLFDVMAGRYSSGVGNLDCFLINSAQVSSYVAVGYSALVCRLASIQANGDEPRLLAMASYATSCFYRWQVEVEGDRQVCTHLIERFGTGRMMDSISVRDAEERQRWHLTLQIQAGRAR